jgi:photosystem I subunit 10
LQHLFKIDSNPGKRYITSNVLNRQGENHLMYSHLLLAVSTVAQTVEWNPKVALVMILCNVLAIAIGRATIKFKNVGPQLPVPLGLSLGAFIGTLCLGHILGTGAILGLANAGVL